MEPTFAQSPVYVSSPVHIPLTPNDRRIQQSPFEMNVSYVNNTGKPVTVCLRNGLKFVVSPIRTFELPVFKIRIAFYFNEEIKDYIVDVLSVIRDDAPSELKVMREAVREVIGRRPAFSRQYEVVLDYPVSLETLESYGGTVYVQDADVLLSTNTEFLSLSHPFSFEGQKADSLKTTSDLVDGKSFVYAVDLIDNEGGCGNRFIPFNKQVYKVRAKTDGSKRSGVYVTATAPAISEFGSNNVEVRYFGLDPESLGHICLYSSFKDADALGDVVTQRKERLAEMEHEIQIAKREATMQSERYSREKEEREHLERTLQHAREMHAAELKHARELYEHELAMHRMREKDRQEEKSTDRKDTSEILKFIPTIIVGVGAIIAAWAKFFNNKD